MSDSTSELAVYLAAATHGADAGALVDSREFMARVAGLDPGTPNFVQRVQGAVQDAVRADPALRLGAAPPSAPAVPAASTEPAPPPAVPGGRRPSNAEVAEVAARRAVLTADYAGEVTERDLAIAEPRVVAKWVQAGKLAALGVPAQKRRSRR